MNKLNLTGSEWIKLDLQIKIFTKDEIKLYDINYEDIKGNTLYELLNTINDKNYKFIENYYNFLAYVFQTCKSNALVKKKVITEANLEFEHKVIESCMINKLLIIASILENFAKNKGINALGSIGIELGLATVKDFEWWRGYLIQKIYLENIFDAIMEYIEKNSLDKDVRNLASMLKNSEINKRISLKYLKKFVEKEKIDKIKMIDSLMGAEILILSFALSERLFKEAVFYMINLEKANNNEMIEKSLMPIYEMIDKNVESSLINLGFKEDDAKEILSKLRFAERRLC
jgi:hypothetical protein